MEYIPLWEDNIRLPNHERVYFLWMLKDRLSEPGPHRPILFFYDPPIASDLLPPPLRRKVSISPISRALRHVLIPCLISN